VPGLILWLATFAVADWLVRPEATPTKKAVLWLLDRKIFDRGPSRHDPKQENFP
jgi:hypothetical protein